MLFTKINQLCQQNGITITELERILGFGNGTIHKWDVSQPSIEKVKKVADHFKTSIDYLVRNEKFIPSKDSMEIAIAFDSLSSDQKGLVKCYLSLIKNGQEVRG